MWTKQLTIAESDAYTLTLEIKPVQTIDGLFEVIFTRVIVGFPADEQRTTFFWDKSQIQAVKEFL